MDITFETLVELAHTLRAPDGCPWDQKQTLDTLPEFVQKELDEVKLAITNKDFDNLEEEIGDVLFTLALIIALAEEQNQVKLDQILQRINTKIKSRHTWVFGEDKVASAEDAMKLWAQNKKKERENV